MTKKKAKKIWMIAEIAKLKAELAEAKEYVEWNDYFARENEKLRTQLADLTAEKKGFVDYVSEVAHKYSLLKAELAKAREDAAYWKAEAEKFKEMYEWENQNG